MPILTTNKSLTPSDGGLTATENVDAPFASSRRKYNTAIICSFRLSTLLIAALGVALECYAEDKIDFSYRSPVPEVSYSVDDRPQPFFKEQSEPGPAKGASKLTRGGINFETKDQRTLCSQHKTAYTFKDDALSFAVTDPLPGSSAASVHAPSRARPHCDGYGWHSPTFTPPNPVKRPRPPVFQQERAIDSDSPYGDYEMSIKLWGD
ncbi:hypothetical protein [Sodalis praecaptivus]|uniref:hypothetical protein n=1 Tax=Sodalis praecaptivus TaxID=1239307 RepID=UPI0011DCF43E|nr:hypothetical protein [Sodalis praecaptivus]